jgi:hypothetical protein
MSDAGLNDKVSFRAMRDPLNGDETLITVEGIVVRERWGHRADHFTIRTLEHPPRTFVRLASAIEVIAKAPL